MQKPSEILRQARACGYIVGSFSPRYVGMIEPILRAAQAMRSPLFVQISQMELERKRITPASFAQGYQRAVQDLGITIPCFLHLDHTMDERIIREAIDVGFASVMIDASSRSFEENAQITARVAEYAHRHGVQVEGELGRIRSSGREETAENQEAYTDPHEVGKFCSLTGVDYLAVSIGTVHGVYTVREPKLRIDILEAIQEATEVPLVMHGGSGLPRQEIAKTFGRICKLNIATDLERAMLGALDLEAGITQQELEAYHEDCLCRARRAVEALVEDRMEAFLHSAGKVRAA